MQLKGSGPSAYPCHYCGQPATTWDHVVPLSVQTSRRRTDNAKGGWLGYHQGLPDCPDGRVPACMECNDLPGVRYFASLAERKRAIQASLAVRYRRLLSIPDWPTADLAELAEPLRSTVAATVHARNALLRRLRW